MATKKPKGPVTEAELAKFNKELTALQEKYHVTLTVGNPQLVVARKKEE